MPSGRKQQQQDIPVPHLLWNGPWIWAFLLVHPHLWPEAESASTAETGEHIWTLHWLNLGGRSSRSTWTSTLRRNTKRRNKPANQPGDQTGVHSLSHWTVGRMLKGELECMVWGSRDHENELTDIIFICMYICVMCTCVSLWTRATRVQGPEETRKGCLIPWSWNFRCWEPNSSLWFLFYLFFIFA